MSFAVYFREEGYSLKSSKLMGRQAAGDSFLKGLFQHLSQEEFVAVVPDDSEAERFEEKLKSVNPKVTARHVQQFDLQGLSSLKGIFYPGPDVGRLAFQRSFFDSKSDSWSLAGITHTTSSTAAMDAITSLLTCPVQPWDAIICTSRAVKANVETLLQAQVDFLQSRLGITKIVLPRLPIIPLGVDTQDFVFTDDEKANARNSFGITEDTIVVLYVGRLAFHGKAHPLAMYSAIQTAAKLTGKRIMLLECGWHANEYICEAFTEGANYACPDVQVKTLDGRDINTKMRCWASADIFCSLSDNIQETFGIAPVEAMAAGLPAVVSDWDGYKDTVRDDHDGFRIPTMSPAPGTCNDLAYRHAYDIDSYDMYIGHYSSLVSIQQEQLIAAFVALFSSEELRRDMGASGAKRAKELFDWSVIIPQYEGLWAEQTSMRLSSQRRSKADNKTTPAGTIAWPARLDPSIGFANYATKALSDDTILSPTFTDVDTAMHQYEHYRKLSMVNYSKYMIPTVVEARQLFNTAITRHPKEIDLKLLLSPFSVKQRGYKAVAFLCKLGFFNF